VKKTALFLCVFGCLLTIKAQDRKNTFVPQKIGFLYNVANQQTFLFNDKDYNYQTSVYKAQLYFKVASWKWIDFELIVQPQYQQITHQLLNVQFVTPEDPDYEQKRIAYTQIKTMNLYALEFGLSLKILLFKKLYLKSVLGLGAGAIDTQTERLAKGFTFIENASLGLSYQTTKKTHLYLAGNIGHVSNFNFQRPNSGYNLMGFELGFSYSLH
jgi:hypothetical protein